MITHGLALALALGAQDTLQYSVALVPATRSVSVEARLSSPGTRLLILKAPPASGPARTRVAGLAATDDRGRALPISRAGDLYRIEVADRGAVRFRYRLTLLDPVAGSSTGSGFDSLRLYAVTGSLFVAPEPTAYRKTGRAFPEVRVSVYAPAGWQVVTGWPRDGGAFAPRDGEDLIGSVLAAGPDFRTYGDTAGGVRWDLAIRGRRYFTDSALIDVIRESLGRSATALGPIGVGSVSYTADVGRKGRVSGSLQGLSAVGLVWEPSENLLIARSHDTFHETLHLWFGGVMETERWWTEGVTDYYAARLYAEWTGEPGDLAHLIWQSLDNYLGIPHHAALTMAEETRRGIAGDNTDLLVYRKGMLAGLLLDAAIRDGSGGRRTLDDAAREMLRLADSRASRLVRERELRAAVERAGGRSAGRVWDRVVSGREEITRAEVVAALRRVTGRDLPVQLARKRSKVFRPTGYTVRER